MTTGARRTPNKAGDIGDRRRLIGEIDVAEIDPVRVDGTSIQSSPIAHTQVNDDSIDVTPSDHALPADKLRSEELTAGAALRHDEAIEAATPGAALRGAARNGAWGGAGALVGSLGGFVTTWLVARGLGAGDAGVVFTAIAAVSVATGLLTIGADTGLVWSLPRDSTLRGATRVRALIWVASLPVLAISVLGAAVVWWAAPAMASGLGGGEPLAAALRIMTLALLFGPLEAALAQATRGLGDVRALVVIHQAGLPFVRCAAIGAVCVAGAPTVRSLAMAWSVPVVVALVAAAVVLRQRVQRAERRNRAVPEPADRELAASFWRFSLPRGVAATGSLALTWSDVLIVAALTSPREAGIYAAASRFAVAGQIALQAMRLGIAPQISVASARGDTERVSLLYGVTAQWAVVVCWPMIITIAAFAPLILGVFGPDFRAGATALAIICGGMLVAVAAGNVGTVLLMSGESSWLARLVWSALIVNIALNVVTVPIWGIEGAAASWTASLLVENVGGAILLRRRLGVGGHGIGFWATSLATLAVALASAVVCRAVLGDDAVAFVVHLAVVCVAMAGVIRARHQSLHIGLLLGRREDVDAT